MTGQGNVRGAPDYLGTTCPEEVEKDERPALFTGAGFSCFPKGQREYGSQIVLLSRNERVRKKRELDALLARDRELDALFERLYEDNVSGKIDDARFAKMAKRYEQEQGENAGRIKTLRLEVKKLDEKRMDVDDFLETVRRYTDATKITKRRWSSPSDLCTRL